MPTPRERISRTTWVIVDWKSFDASLNSRCASSKKNTSFGLSVSPTSGSVSYSRESSHMRKVENSSGLPSTLRTPSRLTTPRSTPSAPVAVRKKSFTSISGVPKNTSAPWSANVISSRRMTPTVAFDSPPSSVSSALPSSLTR